MIDKVEIFFEAERSENDIISFFILNKNVHAAITTPLSSGHGGNNEQDCGYQSFKATFNQKMYLKIIRSVLFSILFYNPDCRSFHYAPDP